MTSAPALVYVVDDDDAVRSALKLLVKSVGLAVEGFSSAPEFLARFDAHRSSCLVLDVRMPGMSGLDLQQELNQRGAIIPVIFITGHGDVPMAVDAMQHGAFDFLQKPFRDQDLIDRIQRALARDATNRQQLQQGDRIREHLAALTPREHEVLKLLVSGKQNKVMAADLGVSQRTVEIHRARVMEKMEANSVAQLVRMVIEQQATGPASV